MIGKRLNGRYRILRTIGGGGMANVYLAHDMILDRDVAVKVLRLDYVNENDLLRRFQREAQSATSLTHPNIVTMYDVGDEGNDHYLVMEYVEGMTLKEYIQYHSPVPLDDAINIMSQLTSAISHAHHNGIIHRDIKPQNILIDLEGNIKITDFGIAMALSATSITQTNSVMGTVHYLSPEQARGGVTTKKSDIYSLGIVMFELITGRLPFEGESAVSIALKHLQSDIPAPSKWSTNLPQSVENVILKATTKDAFYRYSSAEEMQEDLKTVLNEDRMNEQKFVIEPDNDTTRVIPVIREERKLSNLADTKVRSDNVSKREEQTNAKANPKKKNKKDKKNKKKKKKWPWILGAVLLILLISTVIMAAFGMFGSSKVAVPDIVGESLQDAEDILEEQGLVLGEVTYEPKEDIPEDEVLRTDPKATRSIELGSKVDVFVSSGKATIELGDYTGRTIAQVKQLLDDIEFLDVEEEYVFDSSPEGEILDQTPKEGEEVIPSETTLQLTISQGEEMATVEDLLGMTRSEITDFEKRSGLEVNVTRNRYSDKYPAGTVMQQDPTEGTKIPKGDVINVIESDGEEPPQPKELNETLTIEYKETEVESPPEEGVDPPEVPGDPQTIRIFIKDRNRDMTIPFDEFTITETEERNISLVIEPGQTGGYRVERDGETIFEKVIEYDEIQ
ncbi:Stk1 family PASTA domain-containing Ser/Thr kinase [Jeotgalibacillus marinus]|uniref:non-specific serine/threonine protein kinase n=1 Tax=Jeotgalibacillus marinus TaxID=86667 RepID=A0ABV3Q1X4_9BACL